MAIKGFDFYLTESGAQEAWQNSGDGSRELQQQYIVFCDGVCPSDQGAPGTSSQAAATLAEQALRHYLDKAEDGQITEEAIYRAFAYASRRVLELYGEDENAVAVPALVMAIVREHCSETNRDVERLLIAGVGDSRVYAVHPGTTNSVETLFADPQTPLVSHTMTAEERCLSLHNALGVGEHFTLHTRYHEPEAFERYLIATYGSEQLLSTDEIAQIALRPHDPDKGAATLLAHHRLGSHAARVCAASYEASVQPLLTTGAQTEEPIPQVQVPVEATSRRREKVLALALTAVTCALMVFVAMEVSDGESTPASLTDQHSVSAPAEPQLVQAPAAEEEKAADDAWAAAMQEQVREQEDAIADLTARLDAERETVQSLRNEIAIASDEDLTRQRLAELQEKSRQDAATRRSLQSEVHRLSEALGHQEALLEAANATNLSYVNRYEELEARFADKMDEFSVAFGQQKERQSFENTQLQERVQNLQDKLARAEAQNQSLTADLEEMMNRSRSSKRSGGALASKQQTSKALAAAEKALDEEQRRNQVLKEELQEALGLVERAREDRTSSTRATSEVETQLTAAQATNQKLEAQLKEALARVEQVQQETSTKAESTSEMETRFAELNRAKEKLEAELARTIAQLTDAPDVELLQARWEKRISELSRQLATEQERSASLTEKLEGAAEEIAELGSAAGARSELETQVASLNNDLADQQQKNKLLQAEVDRLLVSSNRVDEEIQRITNERDQAQTAAERLQQQRVELMSEKSSLMDKITAMQKFQELYTTERALRLRKEQQFAEFTDSLRQQQAMFDQVRSSREEMARELARIRQDYDDLLRRQSTTAQRPTTRQVMERAIASSDEPLRTSANGRVHVVARGETLSGIAQRYFGTTSRWNDIYEANSDQLETPRSLRVGMNLVIPE